MFLIPRLTAAVSTPVGPPPQMTKLSRRLRSSGVVVGKLASSKLSVRAELCETCVVTIRHTHDAPSSRLSISNGFELEAVL